MIINSAGEMEIKLQSFQHDMLLYKPVNLCDFQGNGTIGVRDHMWI